MFTKFLILLTLGLIIVSLGFGLFYLLNDGNRSRRTVQALTTRIVMSMALFFLLVLGYQFGILRPHGIRSSQPSTPQPAVTAPAR
jgi:ABC-type Na+ efflux pump permease subunit